uniref:Uncharacterized protein n=1 Tax=Syphacia muris TaxID=451379 RepID=A0A0N5AS90_9BILA
MDPADKLALLRSGLKGPAKDLIRDFATIGENYPEVVTKLKGEYANREEEARKLPPWIIPEVHRKRNIVKEWNLRELRNTVQDIVNCQKEIYRCLGYKRYKDLHWEEGIEFKNSKGSNFQAENKIHSTIYSVMEPKQQPRKQRRSGSKVPPKTRCIFCGRNHFNDFCSRYRTLSQRIKRAANLGCCRRCLRNGHSSTQFKAELRPFFYCKSEQHKNTVCSAHLGTRENDANRAKKEDTLATPTTDIIQKRYPHLCLSFQLYKLQKASNQESEGKRLTQV